MSIANFFYCQIFPYIDFLIKPVLLLLKSTRSIKLRNWSMYLRSESQNIKKMSKSFQLGTISEGSKKG